MMACGEPRFVPERGDAVARMAHEWLRLPALVTMYFLVFFVVDATVLLRAASCAACATSRRRRQLARDDPEDVRAQARRARGIPRQLDRPAVHRAAHAQRDAAHLLPVHRDLAVAAVAQSRRSTTGRCLQAPSRWLPSARPSRWAARWRCGWRRRPRARQALELVKDALMRASGTNVEAADVGAERPRPNSSSCCKAHIAEPSRRRVRAVLAAAVAQGRAAAVRDARRHDGCSTTWRWPTSEPSRARRAAHPAPWRAMPASGRGSPCQRAASSSAHSAAKLRPREPMRGAEPHAVGDAGVERADQRPAVARGAAHAGPGLRARRARRPAPAARRPAGCSRARRSRLRSVSAARGAASLLSRSKVAPVSQSAPSGSGTWAIRWPSPLSGVAGRRRSVGHAAPGDLAAHRLQRAARARARGSRSRRR